MLEQRQDKIRSLIRRRQSHFTVILENVKDPHNVGAIMRTCDAVGIREIFLIYTQAEAEGNFVLGKRASSGARKWVDVYEFNDVATCMQHVRAKGYEQIWATKIVPGSVDLYDLDMTQKIALLFGTESLGLSDEAVSYADGNFLIPQAGMVQSLNVSVACAVTLYEGYRQRMIKGYYSDHPTLTSIEQEALYSRYAEREMLRVKGKNAIKMTK